MHAGLSTGLVAQFLGTTKHRLDYLTRDRQVRPLKGQTGAFVWSWADVTQAAALLGLPAPDENHFRQAATAAIS